MLFSKSFSAGFGGQGRNIPLGLPEPAFFLFVTKLLGTVLFRTSVERNQRFQRVSRSSQTYTKRTLADPAAIEANQLGKSHLGSELSKMVLAVLSRS